MEIHLPSEPSWGADERSFEELCPSLEPGDNWTVSQVDFEWTSEGTDEFLGHGDESIPDTESR